MSLTFFVVSRNWASSPLRICLSLLGIALGVAIVVAIYVMDHNTIQSRLRAQDRQRGPVDLEVAVRGQDEPSAAVAARLRAHPGVAQVAVWQEARGLLRSTRSELDVAVFGLAPLPAGSFGHYAVGAGRDLEATDAEAATPGLLLGLEAARQLGVGPGDTVQIGEPERMARVECRDGVLVPVPPTAGAAPFRTSATVVGILTPDRLGGRDFGQVAVVALELAQRLQRRGAELFHVQRTQGADLDRLRRDLRQHYAVADQRQALIGEAADERAFRNGLKVLGGLALLLGMYVVFQTLSHSLVARVRQLGLLRCLGAGTGSITRIFLLDALWLGGLGSVLGVGLGLLLADQLRAHDVSSLGLGKAWSTFEIPIFPVVWTGVLGVLFTLAGAMFPLVRARSVPALDILRARGLAPSADDGVDLLRGLNGWMFALLVFALPLAYLAMTPLAAEEGAETLVVLLELVGILVVFGSVLLLAPAAVAWLGRLLLLPLRLVWPLPTWLVGKVVVRSAGRVAAAVCGLSAVLLALLGLKSLTWSLRAEVAAFAQEALDDRLFLRTAPCRPEQVALLQAVPGVASIAAAEGEQRGNGFFLRGMAVGSLVEAGGPLAGRPELLHAYTDLRQRSVVISSRLARHQNLQPGDGLTLADRNGGLVVYKVLAVGDGVGFDMDERAFALADPRWLRQDFCTAEASVEHVALRLQPGADADAVLLAARRLLPAVPKSKTGAWIRDFLQRDVDRDFVLFDLLLLLMLVLAGVGLLNGMTIAALGRARELGVLRALGIRRADLGGSFVLEGLMVGAIAAVLSVALAVPMGYLLVRGMNQVAALAAPFALPWRWLWLTPVLALLTGVLAGLVPAWRSLRQSPAEAVRYE